jgi:hypothetical protein
MRKIYILHTKKGMVIIMTINWKKIIIITAFIIIAAVGIVLCVNYFTNSQVNEFDGTLVNSLIEYQSIL